MRAVLDTSVLLRWFADREELTPEQLEVIDAATEHTPLIVSDISLWEVATLHGLGRIRLRLPLRDWLDRAVGLPQVERAGISPAVAAHVAALPSTFHRDPADRIIVATAQVHMATLVTQDRRIIDAGLVPTLN